MQWRGKLLFSLILYAAGFATAIYVLAPSTVQASNGQTSGIDRSSQENAHPAGADTQAWAASVKVGMTKAFSFAEENALLLADKIRIRIKQSTIDKSGD